MSETKVAVLVCEPAPRGSVVGAISGRTDVAVFQCECCENDLVVGPVEIPPEPEVNDQKRVCGKCAAMLMATLMADEVVTTLLAKAVLDGKLKLKTVPDDVARGSCPGMTCVCGTEDMVLGSGVKREDLVPTKCSECGQALAYSRHSPMPDQPRVVCVGCHGGLGEILRDVASGRARVPQGVRDMHEASQAVKH